MQIQNGEIKQEKNSEYCYIVRYAMELKLSWYKYLKIIIFMILKNNFKNTNFLLETVFQYSW